MSRSKNKSIPLNMVLSMVKGLMGVVFPLITFPYVSRILGVDYIGKYNFANSIVGYFVLIAGFGISTYAIRSGAKIRENKESFQIFANQVFTINLISTVVSYFLLFLLLITVNKVNNYAIIIIILSLQIVFNTIGIDWIYSIYEDYFYITLRSIAFQIFSLSLLFLLVHTKDDINIYVAITVISSVGSNLLNYFHAKKYCNVKITIHPNIKEHIKPILLFLGTSITVTIYVNSDITILGFLCDDHTVGIYSVSVKIYTILKSILASSIVVSIPRMSALWGEKRLKEFSQLGNQIYDIFLSLIVPAILGLIIIADEVILLISGSEYTEAKTSLVILSISLFFCLGAGFWSQGILIPQNQEKRVFNITIISAAINVILNMIMIPFGAEKASALTTVIAEGIVFFYCRNIAIKSIEMHGTYKKILKVIMGCIPMIFIGHFVKILFDGILIRMILIIGLSVIAYIIVEIALKNEIIVGFTKSASKKGKQAILILWK